MAGCSTPPCAPNTNAPSPRPRPSSRPAPLAGAPRRPCGRPLPLVAITGGADWKHTPTIKSRLAGGFCLRAPAQGSCPYANICEHCPNFRTDTGFLAVLGAQRADAAGPGRRRRGSRLGH